MLQEGGPSVKLFLQKLTDRVPLFGTSGTYPEERSAIDINELETGSSSSWCVK